MVLQLIKDLSGYISLMISTKCTTYMLLMGESYIFFQTPLILSKLPEIVGFHPTENFGYVSISMTRNYHVTWMHYRTIDMIYLGNT